MVTVVMVTLTMGSVETLAMPTATMGTTSECWHGHNHHHRRHDQSHYNQRNDASH
jgi:hypothetical protein